MTVRLEVRDRVAHVVLDRPEVRNAASFPLLRDLDAVLQRCAEDPGVRCVVLSGAGEAFSSGHDLGSEEQRAAGAARRERRQPATESELRVENSHELFLELTLRWRDLPVPTIAAVHGWCLFGGWILASAMDLVVAADDLRLLTTLLQYFTLPYDVGARRAKELLFDRRELHADQALAMGLVSAVHPRAELLARTHELAVRIAGHDPQLLRMAKRAVNTQQDAMGFRAAVTASHAQYHLYEAHLRELLAAEVAGGAPPRTSLVTDLLD